MRVSVKLWGGGRADDSCHHSSFYPRTHSFSAKHSHPIWKTVPLLEAKNEFCISWLLFGWIWFAKYLLDRLLTFAIHQFHLNYCILLDCSNICKEIQSQGAITIVPGLKEEVAFKGPKVFFVILSEMTCLMCCYVICQSFIMTIGWANRPVHLTSDLSQHNLHGRKL